MVCTSSLQASLTVIKTLNIFSFLSSFACSQRQAIEVFYKSWHHGCNHTGEQKALKEYLTASRRLFSTRSNPQASLQIMTKIHLTVLSIVICCYILFNENTREMSKHKKRTHTRALRNHSVQMYAFKKCCLYKAKIETFNSSDLQLSVNKFCLNCKGMSGSIS